MTRVLLSPITKGVSGNRHLPPIPRLVLQECCDALALQMLVFCYTDSQAHSTLVTTRTKDYGTDELYTVLIADRQNAAQTLLNCIVQST